MERTLKNFMETLPQGVVATHVVYVDGKQVYNGDDLIYAMDHCDMLREEEPSTVTIALVTLYHKVEARNWGLLVWGGDGWTETWHTEKDARNAYHRHIRVMPNCPIKLVMRSIVESYRGNLATLPE